MKKGSGIASWVSAGLFGLLLSGCASHAPSAPHAENFFSLESLFPGLARPREPAPAPVLEASLNPPSTMVTAQVFGSYTAGCVRNPSALPTDGMGYKVLRVSRERYYGHPSLIRFIQSYAAEVKASGLGSLLVGDLAQDGGGPMPSGHHSHQTGLDADFWFARLNDQEERQFSEAFRENPLPVVMVNDDGTALTPEWNASHAWTLKSAALRPEVERIFVHPRIKADLCQRSGGQAWLAKIRPWRGHDYHFHVRLRCPADSPHCRNQEPVSGEDGCGAELAQWLAGGSWKVAETPDRPHARPVDTRNLPWQCRPTEVASSPFPRRR